MLLFDFGDKRGDLGRERRAQDVSGPVIESSPIRIAQAQFETLSETLPVLLFDKPKLVLVKVVVGSNYFHGENVEVNRKLPVTS